MTPFMVVLIWWKNTKEIGKHETPAQPDYILEGNPDSPTFPTRAELDELIKRPFMPTVINLIPMIW